MAHLVAYGGRSDDRRRRSTAKAIGRRIVIPELDPSAIHTDKRASAVALEDRIARRELDRDPARDTFARCGAAFHDRYAEGATGPPRDGILNCRFDHIERRPV